MNSKVRLVLEILLALIVICLAVEYHLAGVRTAAAEAGQQAREQANKQSQEQIKLLQSQIDQIKSENRAQVDALVKTVANLKTPAQQVQWSQEQLAAAIKGITISVNPKTGEAQAVIPAPSIPELPAVIEKCQTCQLNLDSATKQLAFSQQQQQQLANQLLNVTQDRNEWKKAAKGGSWIKRAGKAAEYLIIGGAVGYAAAKR